MVWIDALRQDGHDDAVRNRGFEVRIMPHEKGYFGERLGELRRAAGQSQPELAKSSGVPVGTIRELEQGRREPTLGTLINLARGLGLSLGAFDPPPDPPAAPKPTRKPKK
jgi:DNA-binding XRE family transcriptional regulator